MARSHVAWLRDGSSFSLAMLAGSSGYVGSEEFVENREADASPGAVTLGQVKQMHAWTSPVTTPRGFVCKRFSLCHD